MKGFKTIIALLLIFAISAGLIAVQGGKPAAAASKPDKPAISLKANDNTSVKVTIKSTSKAEGYQIYMKAPGANKYKKVKNLKKDGTAERTYTVKGLTEGKYSFKVRAYTKSGSKTVYGSYSKVKSITVKKQTAGGSVSGFSKAKTGDYITFGSYEQDNNTENGKEPIEWLVLSNTGKELFVVSKYALDCRPYNFEYTTQITWEECALRKWLNDEFYNAAFSDADKKLIKTTLVKNSDNPEYGTSGGNDTKDKIFLLSMEDMINTKYGFSSEYTEQDIARRCAPTAYAVDQGLYLNYNTMLKTSAGEYPCYWWLRTRGGLGDRATLVEIGGNVNTVGPWVSNRYGVRPALYIDLNP